MLKGLSNVFKRNSELELIGPKTHRLTVFCAILTISNKGVAKVRKLYPYLMVSASM